MLVFLAVLSVLVMVHELGHLLAAKYFGIKVEEFGLGLPFTKALIKIKFKGTDYSVYPLIFGGFVRLQGEEGPSFAKASQGKTSFWERGRKQRMAVLLAGVVMNVILAVAGFALLYGHIGVPGQVREKITLIKIEPGSPAQEAGLLVHDRITAVEGREVNFSDFTRILRSWGGLKVNLEVERGGGTSLFEGITENRVEKLTVVVMPRLSPPEGQGPLGGVIASFPYLQVRQCAGLRAECVGGILGAAGKATVTWGGRVILGLREIGKSLTAGKVPQGVGGPVVIYEWTKVVAEGGFWPIVELVAILSVNLAIFNILPIPALDGGRMLFVWLEWVRKKRLEPELEKKINSWGFAFLIGLVILITMQDLIRTGILKK